MDITRDQQLALDDALVAPANRLKIGKSNLRLSSDLNSKEATLQVVYDVLKLTPFYKAFQIITDVPEIYMQEFWATTTQFEELPFKEEILTFLRDLCHSGEIKNVDYAYLLWEDFFYQVENKNVKRSNEMYYPRFTKVIVNFFMTKDSSILRRNKVYWHFARDDPMFTMIKVVSRHEDTQLYGAIFPDELTNEAIKDFESCKEYYAIASGAEPPKIKESVKKKQTGSDKTKTSPTAKGKRLKTSAKAAKPAKKKQPTKISKAKGVTVLSEVALTEAEQMELATKRSLIQTHSSHASGSGTDEGTGDIPGVPDVPTYAFDDEQISWKSSEEEDDDEQTDSDNDGDDFVHPKFSTHDEEDIQEEGSDLRVHTPSHYESTNDEDGDENIQGVDVEEEEMDEENTNEEEEVDELYRDVNVNLEGRDTEMTDAPRTIIQTAQLIEDTHVIITPINPEGQQQSSSVSFGFVSNMLNPSPDTGIDYIFNLNTESISLVDVPVTTIVETPLLSATTLPPPPINLIPHPQQTPIPTPVTVPSSSLQDLHSFAVSSIPGIVDAYLANKMNDAVKTTVQLQSDRLRDEAQAENTDFINKLDDNIKKIIKDQVKEQKNLYKALVDTYEIEKLILDTYGDTVSFKRRQDDEHKDEEPSAGSNRGSKRRRARKEPESTSAPKEKTSKTTGKSTEGSKSHHKSAGESAQVEEPMHTAKDLEEPAHQEFKTGVTEMKDPRESFNELMDTPLDFLAFVMNRLKVDTLTPELLAGPTFKLMKRSCKSLVELEYFFKEVYKATTDQLDWNNIEDWIIIRRDDDKLYKFKEGDFNRLRIQDIEDMLLLLVQGKLTNLTVEERLAFNVSLSDLKRREAYTAYFNPRGFIYQNKDKKNRLMRIDKQYKFSDGTPNDVQTALNDRLKGIRMKYLPQTIWRQSDRDKAGAMIQAIDKQLKTRRIMQSLEKFVGGRLYEGDF
ncbi:hypothetical protein Tco_0385114 [Tanacetum coccineum]